MVHTGDPGPSARTELITRVLVTQQSTLNHPELTRGLPAPSDQPESQ